MQAESIFLSFLSIFVLVGFFITLTVQKFSHLILNGILLDTELTKPQAFHRTPIPRSGGLASIILFSVFILMYYFFFNNFIADYLFIGLSLFFIGFLDDIKTNISPKNRLFLMIVFLIVGIYFFKINLSDIDWIFLDQLLSNNIFHVIFVLFCFLFIINGANLIDGFNGLLTINFLIINSILLYINLIDGNSQLCLTITGQIKILFCFLLFNFPKAKMFLGDGGSYLFGALMVLNIIKTNNSYSAISSFFFCILLFYVFFEVFFSFFRKLYLKKSPLKPDNNHLHMLSYRWINELQMFKDCNYLNAALINTIYLVLIFPALFLKDNTFFCKYWFFSLLFIYILFYVRLYSFTKK